MKLPGKLHYTRTSLRKEDVLRSMSQGERVCKAETADLMPVFSLLSWATQTDCLLYSPRPTSLLSSSSHSPSRQRACRSHQLHDHPLHLERPQPPVHQWHQPGLQGTGGLSSPQEKPGESLREAVGSGVGGRGRRSGGTPHLLLKSLSQAKWRTLDQGQGHTGSLQGHVWATNTAQSVTCAGDHFP